MDPAASRSRGQEKEGDVLFGAFRCGDLYGRASVCVEDATETVPNFSSYDESVFSRTVPFNSA